MRAAEPFAHREAVTPDGQMAKIQTLGYKIELVDLEEVQKLPQLFDEFDRLYSDDALRARAKEDGVAGIPLAESPLPSPFERELVHAASQLAVTIGTTYRRALEQVDGKIKAERTLVETKYKNVLESCEDVYAAEKEAAENVFGLKDSHAQLELNEKRYNQIYEEVKRDPVVYIPHWAYIFLAFFIFVGEVPLNALVFQMFGENQVMTWVMALIVGLCIPVSAHFIGIKLREHGRGLSMTNILKGVVALAVVIAALYGLSVMRQTYLGSMKESLGLTDSLVENSFMFFWLNVAVLAAAVVIAYLAHDPIPGYDVLGHRLKVLRKKVAKAERTKVDLLKKAAMKRVAERDKAAAEHRDNCNRVDLMKGTYDQLLTEGKEWESRCLIVLRQKAAVYRHENLKNRESKALPRSFETEPELNLELRKMKEKLDNESDERRPAA